MKPPARIPSRLMAAGFALVACVQASAAFDVERTMDEPTARAMLGRFGFGADRASLAAAMRETPRQYLMQSIQGSSNVPGSIGGQISAMPISQPMELIWSLYGPGGSARVDKQDTDAFKALQKTEREYASDAVQARLLTMANSDNQGHEALLSFWLNHFSIYAPKNLDKFLAWDYARSIERAMADDSFESLLRASFFHPAMQVYLDNAQSTAPDSTMARAAEMRGRPMGLNENLARELMELHTLGVDAGYSQNDVHELARIITGAGIYSPRMNDRNLTRAGATRIGLFLFDPRRHDYGEKHLLGLDFPAGHGLDEIDRALHVLAMSPATAHHIAFQLARRFLADEPPARLVDAMAAGYLKSGGKISATLLPLLSSPEFAHSLTDPAKYKEPVDYLLSAARAVCSGTPIGNRYLLAASALDMGEAPFMHTTPDGYGATRADWLSPVAMAKRTRLAMAAALGRVPLAGTVADADGLNLRKPEGRAPWMGGEVCQPDLGTVERLVGPVSARTDEAGKGLSERNRIALLLASPEFMNR